MYIKWAELSIKLFLIHCLPCRAKKDLMLVSRYNPPLHCVKTLNDKTLYTRRDGWFNLPYSSRAIREYASTPYIGMTQSSHRLNSRIQPALFFLSSAHCNENFSYSRYYFSHFFPKISSLYLAKPRKYGLLQFWHFHLGCSFIIFIIRLNFYKAYLRNGAT